MKHRCAINDCGALIPAELLMCKKHWSRVPKLLKREIDRHFVPGQEHNRNLIKREYFLAAVSAKDAVMQSEGRLL